MNRIKGNIRQNLIIASLAIAFSSLSGQTVNAQNLENRVPEIGWKSRLNSLGLNKAKNVGKTYDFYCQPASEDFMHGSIWGTNTYTTNSSICSTAVHAGMISESGGFVSIQVIEGQEFYTGSTKNQIRSEDHAGTNFGFTFVGESLAVDNFNTSPNNQQQRPSTIKGVMVNSVQRGLERTIEEAISDIFN
ncbi:MAG: LCCL domain-containing protein [Cyanobacteria bacterium P01_G01_bin.67]